MRPRTTFDLRIRSTRYMPSSSELSAAAASPPSSSPPSSLSSSLSSGGGGAGLSRRAAAREPLLFFGGAFLTMGDSRLGRLAREQVCATWRPLQAWHADARSLASASLGSLRIAQRGSRR